MNISRTKSTLGISWDLCGKLIKQCQSDGEEAKRHSTLIPLAFLTAARFFSKRRTNGSSLYFSCYVSMRWKRNMRNYCNFNVYIYIYLCNYTCIYIYIYILHIHGGAYIHVLYMCKGIWQYLYIFLISCFVGPLLTCKTSQGNKNTTVQRALVYGIEHKCLIYDMIWYDMMCNQSAHDPCKQRTTHIFHLDVMMFFSNSKWISPNWSRLDDNWQGQLAWCQSLTVGFVLHDLSWMKWYDVLVLL